MYCEKCNHTGYIKTIKNEEIYLEPCECKIKEEALKKEESLFSETKLPLLYRTKTFDNFFGLDDKYKESINFVKNYIKEKKYSNGLSLYISGPSNSGKTFLSTLICKDLLKNNLKGLFLSFTDLLNNFSSKWGAFFQELKKLDFLCIDRLIETFNYNIFFSFLEDVISFYFENKKVLIITSRLSMNRLQSSKLFVLVPILKRFMKEINFSTSYDSSQILKLKQEYNY